MPEPIAIVARTNRNYCPHESPRFSRRLRALSKAPLVARPGRGFIYVQTPESRATEVAAAIEELLGSRPLIIRPPKPKSSLEAPHLAVQLADQGHYWLAHEVLEHAWGMGANWLHAPTVATAALVKAQEGNTVAATWIVRSLGPRIPDHYKLVDWKCVAEAVHSIASCRIPYWAGECIGARVYTSPPAVCP